MLSFVITAQAPLMSLESKSFSCLQQISPTIIANIKSCLMIDFILFKMLAANGLQLGEVADFEALTFDLVLNFI
jgi:hypothetical protein